MNGYVWAICAVWGVVLVVIRLKGSRKVYRLVYAATIIIAVLAGLVAL
jgi:uncharacterized membrane protein YcaP (DUF421 family)